MSRNYNTVRDSVERPPLRRLGLASPSALHHTVPSAVGLAGDTLALEAMESASSSTTTTRSQSPLQEAQASPLVAAAARTNNKHQGAEQWPPPSALGSSPSQRMFRNEVAAGYAWDHLTLPLLSEHEMESRGAPTRVPSIDLHLPRLTTPMIGTPRSVYSGFIARANQSTQRYLKILDQSLYGSWDLPAPVQDDAIASAGGDAKDDQGNGGAASSRHRPLNVAFGTNEDHASQFNVRGCPQRILEEACRDRDARVHSRATGM